MLIVQNLKVTFVDGKQSKQALHGISFELNEGEILGVVGESGCGKSITNYALMGLLPEGTQISAERFELSGHNLLCLTPSQWIKLRRSAVAMIFQDPMSALNPSYNVQTQLLEALRTQNPGLSTREGVSQALTLLKQVGISEPELRLKSYPHELSGGMAQRVMIAMALSTKPTLLIADEPTTALDITIQAQILLLLKSLCKQFNMAMILVSHNIGVVKMMADRIQVMYSGEIVEQGPTLQLVTTPRHPYTQGLLRSVPGVRRLQNKQRLQTIPGMVPAIDSMILGCRFYARCSDAHGHCLSKPPLKIIDAEQVKVRCHLELK